MRARPLLPVLLLLLAAVEAAAAFVSVGRPSWRHVAVGGERGGAGGQRRGGRQQQLRMLDDEVNPEVNHVNIDTRTHKSTSAGWLAGLPLADPISM